MFENASPFQPRQHRGRPLFVPRAPNLTQGYNVQPTQILRAEPKAVAMHSHGQARQFGQPKFVPRAPNLFQQRCTPVSTNSVAAPIRQAYDNNYSRRPIFLPRAPNLMQSQRGRRPHGRVREANGDGPNGSIRARSRSPRNDVED